MSDPSLAGRPGLDRDKAIQFTQETPFAAHLGMRLIEAEPGRVVVGLTVTRELTNRADNMHGGAIMGLADAVGGSATLLHIPEGARTVTIESKTNFFSALPLGEVVRAECTALHRGRTTMVWQTQVFRADGKLAAQVTQTQLVMYPGKT